MTTEHTEHTDGTENRENWDMGQDREEFHHEGTKDTKGEDRPDLELERLVMGDRADGVRLSQGWLVREDVVRGAVEMITRLAGDVDGHGRAQTGTDPEGVRPLDMKAMAEAWVRRVRGDALVNPEAGCGCELGDLMPCDHNTCDCMPARRFFCLECEAPTYQGCLGTPVLPPQCYECSGPTVLWPEGAPVPEKVTTKNTDHTEEGVRA